MSSFQKGFHEIDSTIGNLNTKSKFFCHGDTKYEKSTRNIIVSKNKYFLIFRKKTQMCYIWEFSLITWASIPLKYLKGILTELANSPYGEWIEPSQLWLTEHSDFQNRKQSAWDISTPDTAVSFSECIYLYKSGKHFYTYCLENHALGQCFPSFLALNESNGSLGLNPGLRPCNCHSGDVTRGWASLGLDTIPRRGLASNGCAQRRQFPGSFIREIFVSRVE